MRPHILVLGLAPFGGAWHVHVRPRSSVRMALPAGWTPAVGLPQGVSRLEGFLGSAKDKDEAETALKVKVSDDESLWEQNKFTQYVSDGEWVMTQFERVVLLFLYLKLKASKVFADWAGSGAPGQYYEEYIEGPPFGGRSTFNRWVVYGYVSETERIVRSSEGESYGEWVLAVLEPESTPTTLKVTYLPQSGARFTMVFERGGQSA
jgi:hypothetical protein